MKYISSLQYITQKQSLPEIEQEVKSFLNGGGDWVQLRMKGASKSEFLAAAKKVKELCYAYNATFIINDSIEVFLQCGADGVHLGKGDMPTSEARRLIGNKPIIGRTANTRREIEILSNQANDYIGLGPFRWTSTKENISAVLGQEGFELIFEELDENEVDYPPIVAIGSVTIDDIPFLMNIDGVHGLAVSGSIANAENPTKETMLFLEELAPYLE